MSNSSRPDVLVLGDSHALSLMEGCRRNGLQVDGLSFSGLGWHRGTFGFSRNGLMLRNLPAASNQLRALRERVGPSPFQAGIPVIASVGYHLGRLVPPFGMHGHVPASELAGAGDDQIVVSEQFLQDYLLAYRERHIRMLQLMSRRTPTVVVAPPPAHARPGYTGFRNAMTALLRKSGLRVHDPASYLVEDGCNVMPPELTAPDGHHGTGQYGQIVIARIIAEGLLPSAPRADTAEAGPVPRPE